jgi:hypothetical protein
MGKVKCNLYSPTVGLPRILFCTTRLCLTSSSLVRVDPQTRTPIGQRRNKATSLVHTYRADQWASSKLHTTLPMEESESESSSLAVTSTSSSSEAPPLR